jgi:hypothetical protein
MASGLLPCDGALLPAGHSISLLLEPALGLCAWDSQSADSGWRCVGARSGLFGPQGGRTGRRAPNRGWGLLASRLRDWSCAHCLMDLVWSAGVEPSPRCLRVKHEMKANLDHQIHPRMVSIRLLRTSALESHARYKLTRWSFDPL